MSQVLSDSLGAASPTPDSHRKRDERSEHGQQGVVIDSMTGPAKHLSGFLKEFNGR